MKLAKDKWSGRPRLSKNIALGLAKSRKLFLVEYPDIKLSITDTNKKINSYEAKDVKCNHCIHYSGCWRKKHRKNFICKDFRGERFNLQVCEDCGNVRIIEHPKRIWGVCDPCMEKRELRKDTLQKTKSKLAKEAEGGLKQLYKKVKKYRIEQLSKEWDES